MSRYPDAPLVVEAFEGEWRFLSHFYESPVEYRGVYYRTIEHAFQAAKTLDLAAREKIRQVHEPAEAKRLGRGVRLRPGWEVIKLDIMRHLLEQKFTVYPTLRRNLLGTGEAELIEGNRWNDRYWGVCGGQGENHLGRLIMEIRAGLRERA